MNELFNVLKDGGIVAFLFFCLCSVSYFAYILFQKTDKTQSILVEIKNIERKNNENNNNILKEIQISNKIAEAHLDTSKAQLESSNKIIDLHSKILGDKLDKLDKNIDELKFEIKRYENAELATLIKRKENE
ncbi:hypothetical protein C3H44_03270 [Campylobacter jejuni]|uniref:hypothetical protein n=1 Tax=Campylobacter jejuni TaxID=197 RepID=UPI000F8020B8|nr:hypothetical protein [Campylobacter jejuni]RTI69651.1 hypothetical protein C3I19_04175 [Campylobacter jejuni]RTI77815.1 hypothetical protein C3I11_03150 [Campylobacter jejuni]RTJ16007.1 hypothetical protein C3H90_04935 [Campylobacter jejuni]RTJ25973.1 hypothetical protein C3H82_02980 [Campylobacter jejuni]RTJ28470.1 hypothetical protein C3H79_05005 [Campylobacter jejuni]